MKNNKKISALDSKNLESFLHQNYSTTTATAYLREIHIYLSNNPTANTYTYTEVIESIGSIRKRYQNPKTIKRILASIKTYYSYLCFIAFRKDNPAKAIQLKDKISRDIQLQDLFTNEELEQLLEYKQERYTALAHRNKVLMSLLIYQALQPKEVAKIELTDINLSEATLYIKPSKTTNERKLPLKANQILLFLDYQNEARPKLLKGNTSTYLLIGMRGNAFTEQDITKHVKKNYNKVFKPRKVTAQTIRQSVITNLLKQNIDLRIVQTFAGHKYPSTTERYKTKQLLALQTAIAHYHPYQ